MMEPAKPPDMMDCVTLTREHGGASVERLSHIKVSKRIKY